MIDKVKKPLGWPAQSVEMRALETLKPRPNNPRTHSADQIEQIAASIKQWGWTVPILVDEAGEIIAGHGRVMAAQTIGITEAPVMVARGWSEAQIRAYVIADNKLATNAGWNDETLRAELKLLEGANFEMALMGFEEAELDELFAKPEKAAGDPKDEEKVPALAKRAVTRPGDVWVMGQHRLLCGDSRSEEALATLMAGAQADCCWTDPPYNVDYKGAAGKIDNDAKPDERFAALLKRAFRNAFTALVKGGGIYVAHADTEGLNFRREFVEAGFKLASCLVWRKQSMVLGHSDYQWQHEPILYGWKPGAAHRWYGDRKETTIRDAGGQLFEQREDGSWIIYLNDTALIVKGDNVTVAIEQGSILSEPKPARSSEHPTMKPVQLVERMLRNSTKARDRVLDLFGGSGTTLIAAHKLGRTAYLLELDPLFCDVIVKRWQEFAGQPAMRERDNVLFGTAEKAA